MANVGEQLTAPESGWTRYDNLDEHFYTNDTQASDGRGYSGGYYWLRNKGDFVKFKFTGNKLRIIGVIDNEPPFPGGIVKINLDGTIYEYNSEGDIQVIQALVFEKTDLSDGTHTVQIVNDIGGYYIWFDAIDIDENGELLPYTPSDDNPSGSDSDNDDNNILRVTIIDSSDHDYQLSKTDIDNFVKWFNNHTDSDTKAYGLSRQLGSKSSIEYLAFDKIISFEVI